MEEFLNDNENTACRPAPKQQLRRQWQFSRLGEDWNAYKRARKHKRRPISKHLRQAQRDRVTEAASTSKACGKLPNGQSTVKEHKWQQLLHGPLAKPNGSLEVTTEGKVNLFKDTFFPPPVNTELIDIPGYSSPTPHHCPPITKAEIERAIRKTTPNKAPGTDEITNSILQKVLGLLQPILHQLFNASLKLRYLPLHFHQSITIVLRKPEKDDYTLSKANRPITLLQGSSSRKTRLLAGGRPILNLRLLCEPKMAIRAAKMMLKTASSSEKCHQALENPEPPQHLL